jgi:hypothetical protein
MLKTLALTIAVGAGCALLAAEARALPLAQGKAGAGAPEAVQLVREGCGPGMQWSERRRRCVADNPRAMLRDLTRHDRCGRGFHWSDRRGRCVRD